MPFSFATLAKRWPIVDEGAPVTLLQHALHRMELAGEFADNVPGSCISCGNHLKLLPWPQYLAYCSTLRHFTLKGLGGVAALVLANRVDELKAQPSQRHRTGRSSRCTRGAGQCRY
jgi:hypothetical protein